MRGAHALAPWCPLERPLQGGVHGSPGGSPAAPRGRQGPHKGRVFEKMTELLPVWRLVGDSRTHKTTEGSYVLPGQY
jgi:hypothetical protein